MMTCPHEDLLGQVLGFGRIARVPGEGPVDRPPAAQAQQLQGVLIVGLALDTSSASPGSSWASRAGFRSSRAPAAKSNAAHLRPGCIDAGTATDTQENESASDP
jgi:hypothetical protein